MVGCCFEGPAEAVSEGKAELPGIADIIKAGFCLLEIDISPYFLCIEHVPQAELQAGFFFHQLLGNSR